jgi:hypothetical protein
MQTAPVHHASEESPEKRLMRAVLEDALGIHRKYAVPGRRRRRLVDETEEWLFSDDASWPLSFVNVCRTLGVDAARLRAELGRPVPANTLVEAPRTAAPVG